jgi:hypothetical protein
MVSSGAPLPPPVADRTADVDVRGTAGDQAARVQPRG